MWRLFSKISSIHLVLTQKESHAMCHHLNVRDVLLILQQRNVVQKIFSFKVISPPQLYGLLHNEHEIILNFLRHKSLWQNAVGSIVKVSYHLHSHRDDVRIFLPKTLAIDAKNATSNGVARVAGANASRIQTFIAINIFFDISVKLLCNIVNERKHRF